MVSSLKSLCRFPALIEILNHPQMKEEIFSLPITAKNYVRRDKTLKRVLYEFLKNFNLVVKSNIERHFVFLIGFEMWKWANYVLKYFDLSFKFSESFIQSSLFTSDGIINEEKAARELLKEQSFSIFLRYNIACQYFLDDIIPGLWKVLQKEPNFKEWLKEQDPESPMIMWLYYLMEINSTTSLRNRRIKTLSFKKRVFLYGLREKNLGAIKYSYGPNGESRKTKTDVKIKKFAYRPFCHFVKRIMRYHKCWCFDLDITFILNPNFLADRNIIIYFLSLMNKSEMKEFFLHFHGSVDFVKWVLLWPFQNQFMDFAHIIFENFDVKEYNMIAFQIISLISDQYTCQFYDYRLLLRHFWIKTPDNLKEQITRAECGEIHEDEMGLIHMMFTVSNFTGDDFAYVNLILKNTNSIDKKNFLVNQGVEICHTLIVYESNFRLTDLFLESLNLDQEVLQTFKEDFTFDFFFESILEQSIKLFEDLCKWTVGSDEIEDFKSEIFHRLTSDSVEQFFFELKEEIPFSFLNKLLKWFLRTDANIEEWKQNIVYSPLIEYEKPYWFDQLLKFRGYSYERITDIKRELLSEKFYEIARMSLDLGNVTEYLKGNVFILCSSNKEKFLEFTRHLRSFYKDSIENNVCLMCLNNNFVNVYGGEEQLNCALHGTEGFISLKKIHTICSSYLKNTKRD